MAQLSIFINCDSEGSISSQSLDIQPIKLYFEHIRVARQAGGEGTGEQKGRGGKGSEKRSKQGQQNGQQGGGSRGGAN